MKAKFVSVVIPAYKQEKTIVEDVRRIEKELKALSTKYEIIVVDDGSPDKTASHIKRIKNKKIRLISYKENQGKGYAVRQGMLKAKGDIVGFIDAGGDIHLSVIPIALSYMDFEKADIVVGSKLHPDSKVNYPLIRKILSWGYRTIARVLLNLKVKDTQVGVKFFKRNVARDVFPRLLVKKFAFDVEMLAVARVLGYDNIHEVPVKLRFRQGTITNSNFWKVSLHNLWDTLAVFYRIRILRYYRKSNRKNWLKV